MLLLVWVLLIGESWTGEERLEEGVCVRGLSFPLPPTEWGSEPEHSPLNSLYILVTRILIIKETGYDFRQCGQGSSF